MNLTKLFTYLFIFSLISSTSAVLGNNIPLLAGVEVNATLDVRDNKVTVGDVFTFTITIEGATTPDEVNYPDFRDIRELTPFEQPISRTEMEWKNNRHSIVRSYTIRIRADDIGQVTIPPATVAFRNGAVWSSEPKTLTINDVPSVGDIGPVLSPITRDRAINDQLRGRYFLKAEVPEKAFVRQAIPIRIFLYRAESLPAPISHRPLQLPGGDDFFSIRPDQITDTPGSDRWESVTIDGQPFMRRLMETAYVLPTKAGRLTLNGPRYSLALPTAPANQRPPTASILGPRNAIDAELPMRPITVNVSPLPQRPSNALLQVVGDFDINMEVDAETVNQFDFVTVSLKIRGAGFLENLSQPDLGEIPGLGLLNREVDSRVLNIRGELANYRNFNYVYQALEHGTIRIPSFDIAIVDPNSGEQAVLSTNEVTLSVKPSEASSRVVASSRDGATDSVTTNRADVRRLGEDIGYIITDPLSRADLRSSLREPFYVKPWFWILQLIPLLGALAIGLVIVQQRIRESGDQSRYKTRKSRKLAIAALKKARENAASAQKDEFYTLLSHSIMDYVGNLIGRPAAGLTTEEAIETLHGMAISESTLDDLESLLQHSANMKYSPQSETTDDRMKLISKAENVLTALHEGSS